MRTYPLCIWFDKELLQLELQFANEEDDSTRSKDISQEQNLTSKQIFIAMYLIDEAMEVFFKKRSQVLKFPRR